MSEVNITPHLRKAGIAELIAQQIRGLVMDHLDKVEEYAAESDPTGDKPVKAAIAFKSTWDAGAQSAKINTKVSYTLAAKDETEDTYDSMQATMEFSSSDRYDGPTGEADPLLPQAVEIAQDPAVLSVTTSTLQRKLRIGYNRAARIFSVLDERDLVNTAD
jgi:DNA segregation ATPase FtsK/SpoIIIE-like protein|tara:strand:- start:8876 stop:9358 length:483 start_codon:yes stop_codon:yes gene_type:complete